MEEHYGNVKPKDDALAFNIERVVEKNATMLNR